MREVLRGFRLKIKGVEVAAGEKVEKIMAAPTLNQQNLSGMNQAIVKMVMSKSLEALREGVKFGTFMKGKTNDGAKQT